MSPLKIAAAQIPANRGDLDGNLQEHITAIEVAARHHVHFLVFSELSLMGYEPDMAETCALSPTDDRVAAIANLAKHHQMQIVVGSAIQNQQSKPYLGAFVFSDHGTVDIYAKMHLGGNESDYFTAGTTFKCIETHDETIGLSICADSSKSSHPAAYATAGVSVYAASVFLNNEWYATDTPRFPRIAVEHGMLVVMANQAASRSTLASVGNSTIWGPDGAVLARVAGDEPALVVASRTSSGWRGENLA